MMGRGVVITGGAGDLGAAMGVELARRGAMVTLIDAKSSAEAAPWVDPVRHAGPDVAYVQADVRDHEAIRAALAAVDPLDVAIGNAGIGVMTDFLDVSVEDWRHHVDVNLHGCFNLGQSAARLMVARRRPGVIIFTGTWIQDVPWPGMSAYCATKSGIKMLAQCMARELAPHGIRVNIIAPGIVNAGPTRRRLETNADFARHAARVIPLDQLQTPEQVAVATAFLCSADASYMTGATLLVDGGCSLFRFE